MFVTIIEKLRFSGRQRHDVGLLYRKTALFPVFFNATALDYCIEKLSYFRFSSTPRRWIIVQKNCVIPVFFNATALDYCIEKLSYFRFSSTPRR